MMSLDDFEHLLDSPQPPAWQSPAWAIAVCEWLMWIGFGTVAGFIVGFIIPVIR